MAAAKPAAVSRSTAGIAVRIRSVNATRASPDRGGFKVSDDERKHKSLGN